jgi:hypothetical protein
MSVLRQEKLVKMRFVSLRGYVKGKVVRCSYLTVTSATSASNCCLVDILREAIHCAAARAGSALVNGKLLFSAKNSRKVRGNAPPGVS